MNKHDVVVAPERFGQSGNEGKLSYDEKSYVLKILINLSLHQVYA